MVVNRSHARPNLLDSQWCVSIKELLSWWRCKERCLLMGATMPATNPETVYWSSLTHSLLNVVFHTEMLQSDQYWRGDRHVSRNCEQGYNPGHKPWKNLLKFAPHPLVCFRYQNASIWSTLNWGRVFQGIVTEIASIKWRVCVHKSKITYLSHFFVSYRWAFGIVLWEICTLGKFSVRVLKRVYSIQFK